MASAPLVPTRVLCGAAMTLSPKDRGRNSDESSAHDDPTKHSRHGSGMELTHQSPDVFVAAFVLERLCEGARARQSILQAHHMRLASASRRAQSHACCTPSQSRSDTGSGRPLVPRSLWRLFCEGATSEHIRGSFFGWQSSFRVSPHLSVPHELMPSHLHKTARTTRCGTG